VLMSPGICLAKLTKPVGLKPRLEKTFTSLENVRLQPSRNLISSGWLIHQMLVECDARRVPNVVGLLVKAAAGEIVNAPQLLRITSRVRFLNTRQQLEKHLINRRFRLFELLP